MDIKNLRTKSISELKQELLALLRESFNLRMQKVSNQLIKPHLIRRVRTSIAQVKTILREKAGEA